VRYFLVYLEKFILFQGLQSQQAVVGIDTLKVTCRCITFNGPKLYKFITSIFLPVLDYHIYCFNIF
jgi:hypothetical protein